MGTVATLTIYGSGEEAEEFCKEMLLLLRGLEGNCLSRRVEGSEIGRINQSAGDKEGFEVSDELEEVLTVCRQVSEASDGAFDVCIGALCRLWNIDEVACGRAQARIPEKQEIELAKKQIGYEKMRLEGGRVYMEEGVSLDLGSVGKGYALDVLASRLREDKHEFRGGVFSLGGSILTFGEKEKDVPWKVGIKNPKKPEEILGYLELSGECYVSTSGDYERNFEADGKRYSHLLDPKTGYPAESGVCSVTILAGNGLLSDALSTACYVLGEERAKELAGQYGVAILLVNDQGEIWCNEEMKNYFVSK